jgi:TRAP-type C4-dicarboxylate transport system permease small subunit
MWDRLARACTRTLEVSIVVSLAVMALLVFGNVVLRYAFDSGIAQSEELARLMFVWLIFLGSILASAQRMHIGFDTLVHKLPAPLRKLLVLATGALMLCACVMFVVGGYRQVLINWDNSYPVLGISYAWLYGVAVVFGLGLMVPIVHNIWTTLRGGPPGDGLTQDLGDRINAKLPDVATGRERQE